MNGPVENGSMLSNGGGIDLMGSGDASISTASPVHQVEVKVEGAEEALEDGSSDGKEPGETPAETPEDDLGENQMIPEIEPENSKVPDLGFQMQIGDKDGVMQGVEVKVSAPEDDEGDLIGVDSDIQQSW